MARCAEARRRDVGSVVKEAVVKEAERTGRSRKGRKEGGAR